MGKTYTVALASMAVGPLGRLMHGSRRSRNWCERPQRATAELPEVRALNSVRATGLPGHRWLSTIIVAHQVGASPASTGGGIASRPRQLKLQPGVSKVARSGNQLTLLSVVKRYLQETTCSTSPSGVQPDLRSPCDGFTLVRRAQEDQRTRAPFAC